MFYKKNIDLLRRKDAHLAARLDAIDVEDSPLIDICETQKEGCYSCRVRMEAHTPALLLHSLVDPVEEAEKRVAQLELKENFFTLVLGFGFGYHVREILKKKLNRGVLLIIEPRLDLLKTSLMLMDFEDILSNPTVAIIEADKMEQKVVPLLFEKLNFVWKVQIFQHPVYCRIVREGVDIYGRNFMDFARYAYLQMGNSSDDTLRGIEAILQNVEYISETISSDKLTHACRNMPAVIVSAGPSLNKNFHLLKNIKGKALIICVDTVLKKLLDEGIVPDMVTTLERGHEIYDLYFKDVEIPEEIIFAGAAVSDRDIFEKMRKRSLVVVRNKSDAEKWVHEAVPAVPSLVLGTSVAHMSFSIAAYLGCNPIILIGQDLAFGDGGETHASNTAYVDEKSRDKALGAERRNMFSKVKVKGNYCDFVETDAVLHSFLKWFEVEVAGFKGKVINATEGGAWIAGTEVSTFKEVIGHYIADRLSDFKISEHLFFPDEKTKKERQQKLENLAEAQLIGLLGLEARLTDMVCICEGLLKEKGNRIEQKHFESAKKIDEFRIGMYRINSLFALIFQSERVFNLQADLQFPSVSDLETIQKWALIQKDYFNKALGVLKITTDLYKKYVHAGKETMS